MLLSCVGILGAAIARIPLEAISQGGPLAYFGLTDLIALGCYRAVRESGREVGVDVSITGYNDIPLLDLMQPPMTSVRVPYRQMGVEAANTLLEMMASGSPAGRPISIRLTPVLSVRESTAPPA